MLTEIRAVVALERSSQGNFLWEMKHSARSGAVVTQVYAFAQTH